MGSMIHCKFSTVQQCPEHIRQGLTEFIARQVFRDVAGSVVPFQKASADETKLRSTESQFADHVVKNGACRDFNKPLDASPVALSISVPFINVNA